MSRIFLVEPRAILRQAISLALFPDHEVQLAASFPDSNGSVTPEFDLIIIDSAALSETGKSSSALLQKLQDWKIPTIWIDDTGERQAAPPGKIVVLKNPILKDALQSAIKKFLEGSAANQNGTAVMPAKERMATKEARTAPASQATAPQIIELVDVVAEPPERRKSRAQEKKTR
jgi:DNA-binding NtrC family response regulator